MKIITKILILSILVFLTSCSYVSKSSQADLIKIKGNIKGFDGKSLYIKHINPINYHSNSVIDSSIVKINGDFEFEIDKSLHGLVNISKNGRQHPIHEILRKDPDKYYYGYCAMFYLPEPTLYLTKESNIQIDWTVEERLDSYTFDGETNTNQEIFYNFYLKENMSKSLYHDGGTFKIMDSTTAWSGIESAIIEIQNKYGLDEDNLPNAFNNYLKTEINLGAVNIFINWYEYTYSNELEDAFATGIVPDVYENALNVYMDSKWNEHSVEYFKLTERFITFNLNKSLKEFNEYYPASDRKIEMAKQKLKASVVDKYVRNISS